VGLHKTNDWDAHGMRGTGSQTLRLESVFIPDAAIQLRRRRQGWHASCSLVAAIAPAVYMSPYLGVARAAATIGRERARRIAHEAHVPFLLGEMETALFEAEIMHESLVTNAAGYDFLPDLPRANRALMAKSLMSRALLATVDKASALTGGAGFSRRTAIEQLVRDVRASEHHPLPDHKQHYFSGMVALGQSPA
jgi:alkylation response protein AidB-like acyl-CoA dehydrogenase